MLCYMIWYIYKIVTVKIVLQANMYFPGIVNTAYYVYMKGFNFIRDFLTLCQKLRLLKNILVVLENVSQPMLEVWFFIVLIHIFVSFRILFGKFSNMFDRKILPSEYIIIYVKREHILWEKRIYFINFKWNLSFLCHTFHLQISAS